MNIIHIPKNNNINFNISFNETLRISHSISYYLKDVIPYEYCADNITYNHICNIVNPLTFVHTIIPGYDFAICKNKYISTIFFELTEIINNCNLFDSFYFKNISILHLTHNHISSDNAFADYRLCFTDRVKCCDFEYSVINELIKKSSLYDLIFFEFNQVRDLIIVLFLICKCHQQNGNTLIKVSSIYNKIMLDTLYILSSFYENVHIIKPSICNITESCSYIVCKGFINKSILIENELCPVALKMINYSTINVSSILSNKLPNYFLYKIEEFNIISGQQQVDAMHLIINLIQFKNDEKIENMKKIHVQKCIAWCERNKVLYNNLIEKSNIFLTKYKL